MDGAHAVRALARGSGEQLQGQRELHRLSSASKDRKALQVEQQTEVLQVGSQLEPRLGWAECGICEA